MSGHSGGMENGKSGPLPDDMRGKFIGMEEEDKSMKRTSLVAAIMLGLVLLGGTAFSAEDMGNMMHQDHDMGKMIHSSTVAGYKFSYHLIDIKAKMEKMKGKMEMGEASHHLMVFISGADGHKAADGDVGFQVEGPDGSVQKQMAMAMSDGFGANFKLDPGVNYVIKTKAVTGDEKLEDQFTFKLE